MHSEADMNLEQLIQFREIAEFDNITRASEALFISQSALTRSLMNLEKELGVKLFDRKKNKIELNEAGGLALQYANQILELSDKMLIELNDFSTKQLPLRICSDIPATLRYFLPIFSRDNKDILISSKTVRESELFEMLLSGLTDIIITNKTYTHSEVENSFIRKSKNFLSVPKDMPLAKHKTAHLSDLDGQKLLLPGNYSLTKDILIQEIKSHSRNYEIYYEEDYFLYREALRTSSYIASASDLTIDYHKSLQNRKLLPIVDTAELSISASYLKNNTDRVAPFIKWIDNYSENYIPTGI